MTGAEFRGVDVDLLADYIGGALAGTPDESVVATLIADDPAWRAAYESLSGGMAAVGAELGRLTSEPMPDDVAARLEAAFAAAPAPPRLASVPGPETAADDAPAVPVTKRPARRLRWATPIAIAAGVVAFAGFSLDYLAGRDSSSADKSASSATGEVDAQSRQDAGAAPLAEPSGDLEILASGTDYTKASLGEAPMQKFSVSEAPEVPKPEQAAASADGPLSRLLPLPALHECLDAIAAENGEGPISPQSVDYAQFDGKPAVVVRFTAASGSWAWASGASCGTTGGDADTLATVQVR